jgi:hypothetical protein
MKDGSDAIADWPILNALANTAGSSSCIGCNEAISGGDPAFLCSESIALYESYMMCLCSGACSMQCDDLCNGGAKSMECSDCESDAVNGCGNELSACAGDI